MWWQPGKGHYHRAGGGPQENAHGLKNYLDIGDSLPYMKDVPSGAATVLLPERTGSSREMFTITKSNALRIQAEHVAWYGKLYPEIAVAEIVAAHTTADALDGEGPHDVVVVNRHIPRGGAIEMLIGKFQQNRD